MKRLLQIMATLHLFDDIDISIAMSIEAVRQSLNFVPNRVMAVMVMGQSDQPARLCNLADSTILTMWPQWWQKPQGRDRSPRAVTEALGAMTDALGTAAEALRIMAEATSGTMVCCQAITLHSLSMATGVASNLLLALTSHLTPKTTVKKDSLYSCCLSHCVFLYQMCCQCQQ